MSNVDSELKRFLAKYNYFHDGILKEIRLSTGDSFSGKSHDLSVTGHFRVILDIWHYNYPNNLEQKVSKFRLELNNAGPVTFCSPGEIDTPNNWSLRKIVAKTVKNKPGKGLLELHGDKYSAKAGKWVGIRLAVIEFGSYKAKVL